MIKYIPKQKLTQANPISHFLISFKRLVAIIPKLHITSINPYQNTRFNLFSRIFIIPLYKKKISMNGKKQYGYLFSDVS